MPVCFQRLFPHQSCFLFDLVSGICSKIQKGAILHCHLDAMCPASFLLDQALLHPSIHVRCPLGPLPTSGPFPSWPYEALLQFKAMPLSFTSETPGIFEHTYDGGWIPLQQVRKEYPGGGKEFDKRVLGLLTIEPGESYVRVHLLSISFLFGFYCRSEAKSFFWEHRPSTTPPIRSGKSLGARFWFPR